MLDGAGYTRRLDDRGARAGPTAAVGHQYFSADESLDSKKCVASLSSCFSRPRAAAGSIVTRPRVHDVRAESLTEAAPHRHDFHRGIIAQGCLSVAARPSPRGPAIVLSYLITGTCAAGHADAGEMGGTAERAVVHRLPRAGLGLGGVCGGWLYWYFWVIRAGRGDRRR